MRDEENDEDQEKEADTAAAIVAEPGTEPKAAEAEDNKQNDEKDKHVRVSNGRQRSVRGERLRGLVC